jgi:hypothetical protein
MQTKDTTHEKATERDESKTEVEEIEEEELEAQQDAQKVYLLTLLSPSQQASVLFARHDMVLPKAVADEVVEFEVEGNGAFEAVLRRPVTVQGATFERFLGGRFGPGRVEGLTGVRVAGASAAGLQTVRAGLQVRAGAARRGPVLSEKPA